MTGGDAEYRACSLQDRAKKVLDTAQALWAVPDDYAGTSDDWLELLASLHYLRHISCRPKGAVRDFDSTFELLVKSKPQFKLKKKQARRAWQRLDEFGLIQAKTLK